MAWLHMYLHMYNALIRVHVPKKYIYFFLKVVPTFGSKHILAVYLDTEG